MWKKGTIIQCDSPGEPRFILTEVEDDCFLAECLNNATNFEKGIVYRFKKYLHTHFKKI
jgi:hypothetical protein